MTDQAYNFAYLDEQTKRMIRRAILKGVAVPGYQVPFALSGWTVIYTYVCLAPPVRWTVPQRNGEVTSFRMMQ